MGGAPILYWLDSGWHLRPMNKRQPSALLALSRNDWVASGRRHTSPGRGAARRSPMFPAAAGERLGASGEASLTLAIALINYGSSDHDLLFLFNSRSLFSGERDALRSGTVWHQLPGRGSGNELPEWLETSWWNAWKRIRGTGGRGLTEYSARAPSRVGAPEELKRMLLEY